MVQTDLRPTVLDAAPPSASVDILIGRQPIYDIRRRIHGYELLFRGTQSSTSADVVDGERATAQVVFGSIMNMGLDTVAAEGLLFVNCTRSFLMSDTMLPPERCVLEILEDVELDEPVLARMRELKSRGYQLALDDFEFAESKRPALALADYVKLDVANGTARELRDAVAELKPFAGRLIAEKIEDESMMADCRDLGFDLFQGYYLKRPEIVTEKHVSSSRLAAVRVISEAQSPNCSVKTIAPIVSSDLGLTFSLLRLSNSALFGTRREITTITEAIARLGTDRVARWAMLLVMVSESDCPRGYVEVALIRARMCELLAGEQGERLRETCFLVGLLSVLDSVTGMVMERLLDSVPLADHLKRAILHRQGEAGRILQLVTDYERGDWSSLRRASITEASILRAFWSSTAFASETARMLSHLGAVR